MSSKRPLFTAAGIPVSVHWSALVAAAFLAFTLATSVLPLLTDAGTPTTRWSAAIVGTLALGASIIAHEFGHALAARRHGVGTHSIKLWIIGGVASLKSEPPTPRAAGEVAVAGPAVSLALGAASFAGAGLMAVVGALPVMAALLAWIGLVNVAMAIFNMLPALPLDGGRLLQAVLWHRSGNRHSATISSSKLGSLLGALMVAVGLFQLLGGTGSGLSLFLIGLFVRQAASTERRHARHRAAVERRRQAGGRIGIDALLAQLLGTRPPSAEWPGGATSTAAPNGWGSTGTQAGTPNGWHHRQPSPAAAPSDFESQLPLRRN